MTSVPTSGPRDPSVQPVPAPSAPPSSARYEQGLPGDDRSGSAPTGPAPSAPGPREPAPTARAVPSALVFDDPLTQRSTDDTDRGWGERSGAAADLARFLDEKPPHHL
ncbi:hypothetical protein RKE29_17980 [Streptomyces sp. B1866]|uniref:hypothetical protein n=1 Tax=Streptomyces sp. B1866 TaxID=3075431 RepID=UPI002890506E|nr:hypothetical protein [Streptomyces sp. B1866]MDT3398514.1 hypothetical protein [Streptomyces sp. B1866]